MNAIDPVIWFRSVFDIDNPKCLYCHNSITGTYEEYEGYGGTSSFHCDICNEEIYYWVDLSLIDLSLIDFTCNNLAFHCNMRNEKGLAGYSLKIFIYDNIEHDVLNSVVKIPFFIPNLTNKEKLVNKVKNYIIFL